MRRRRFLSAAGLVVVVLVMSGCSPPQVAGDFESNEAAKALLANTTWGDADIGFSVSFDSEAKPVDLVLPEGMLGVAMPDIAIDGTPFLIEVPTELVPAEFAAWVGDTYHAYLEPTQVLVEDGQLTIEFWGSAEELDTLADFQLSASADVLSDQADQPSGLDNLEMSFVLYPKGLLALIGPVELFSSDGFEL